VGLQRIGDVADEPMPASNTKLFVRWFGSNVWSLIILLALSIGIGLVVGSTRSVEVALPPGPKSPSSRLEIPRDPSQRLEALTKSFNSLDNLTSREFVKELKLTDRQQRNIDGIVDKLATELARISVDRGDRSPEASSHMGLLMIRSAWLNVESILTHEQMAQWNDMLDKE
jgi:hypothetical protein